MESNFTQQQMTSQDLTASASTSSPLKDLLSGKIKSIHREQTSSISHLIKVLITLLFLFHFLITQQIISRENQNSFFSSVGSLLFSDSTLIITLQITSALLKLGIIECFYFDTLFGQKIIGFQWLNQKMLSSFKTFIEIDTTLSAYLLLSNWRQNIILFLCSFFIEVTYKIYLQNYLCRKDIMYMSSPLHSILLQGIIFCSYSVNAICMNLENYAIFCLSHSVVGIILFIWFYNWGRQLYLAGFYKDMLELNVSMYFCFVIVMIHNMIENKPMLAMEQISKFVITFLVILRLFKMTDRQLKKICKSNLSPKIKPYQLYILDIYKNSYEKQEDESLYLGYLKLHKLGCQRPNCPFLSKEMYDPMLNVIINPKQLSSQRESCFKCLMKCLYENQIKLSENKQIILNYCEFLFNEMGNLYLMMTYLERLDKFSLNIIDLVKISKLKILAQQQNKRLNSELYQNKLDLEDIIQAQTTFEAVGKNILQYLHSNQTIWCCFGEDEVQISQLKQKMAQNFKLIGQISDKWKSISKFFSCQRRWKYTYLSFLIFIKNQIIKLKDIEQINAQSSNKSLFHSQKIFLEENGSTNSLITSAILFDTDSFCVRTKMERDELIITEVSKNFSRHALYTNEEIKGCQLNILMPQQLRESHSQKVVEWIQSGLISNDSSYKICFTSFLDKKKVQLPIVKYYKAHANIERGLEFICLLKINKKQNNMREYQLPEDKQVSRQTSKDTKKRISQQNQINIATMFKKENQFNHLFRQKNIFVKEDTLQPRKSFKQIQVFKYFSRLFIFILLTSIIFLSQITLTNTNNLNDYGSQYINFVTMYRFPMVLGTNYMKSFLNVGNQTKVNSQIASATNGFLANSKQLITLKTLFDPTLNKPSNYEPYYNYPDFQNLTYNQIDIFYQIISDITTLSRLPINRTGQLFRRFNSYVKPSYDNMMNSTKFQLHLTFVSIFEKMKMNQLDFMIAQLTIFILVFVILTYNMHTFIQKIKNLTFIIQDFNLNDLNKILNYWHFIGKSFNRTFKEKPIKTTIHNKVWTKKQKDQNTQIPQSNAKIMLSKKVKKMSVDKIYKNQLLRFRFCIVISMAVLILLTIIIQIQMIFGIQKLKYFEQEGFYFLKYFPTATIYSFGCMQKYYSLQYPQQIQFNPERFSDVMSSMLLFGSYNYIGQMVDENSAYYQKQKNYFFGNPCTYNPAVLTSAGLTISKCESICNGTFKTGLSTVFRYAQQIGQDYMKGKIILSVAKLDEYTISFALIGAFVLDAIATWEKQFTSKIIAQRQFNSTLSIIIASIILVLHMVVNEFFISRKIKKDFEFVCKMYNFYVPEFILINEKILKQKFVLEGLITNE